MLESDGAGVAELMQGAEEGGQGVGALSDGLDELFPGKGAGVASIGTLEGDAREVGEGFAEHGGGILVSLDLEPMAEVEREGEVGVA
ncbi:MAG: hypothetical protein RLZZ244_2236 [Verrucomicrobiota bacterium]